MLLIGTDSPCEPERRVQKGTEREKDEPGVFNDRLPMVLAQDEQNDQEGKEPVQVSIAVRGPHLQPLWQESRGLNMLDLTVDVHGDLDDENG